MSITNYADTVADKTLTFVSYDIKYAKYSYIRIYFF